MLSFSRYQLIAAGVVITVALVGTLALLSKSKLGSGAESGQIRFFEPGGAGELLDASLQPSDSALAEPSVLCIHVTGKVANPGVYELQPGSRVKDAIDAAGGAAANADLENVNLAEKLSDGQQLYIATKGEVPPPVQSVVRGGSSTPSQASSSPASSGQSSGPVKLTTPGQGTVNVNTAGSDELQRLPGIGPAMAERIIEYRRQNGRFNSVEELIEVRGIGPKTLEKMRPFVTL